MSRAKFQHVRGNGYDREGLFMRYDSADTIAVYEVSNWEDLDSSAVATMGKYNVQCGYVYLSDHGPTADRGMDGTVMSDRCELGNALRYCGMYVNTVEGTVCCDDGSVICRYDYEGLGYVFAECLWSYGAKSVVDDSSGNNLRTLIRDARRMVG